MLLLGLDTATAQASVALGSHGGARASFHLVNEGRHAESLTPAIEFVCRLAGTELRAISAVAVDTGPGLFTGLRVGLATAKAIAFAHDIPTIPVSSLEIVAFSARLSTRKIISAIDALSGEVYYGIYEADSSGVRQLTEPLLATAGDFATVVENLAEEVILVGDGARRYSELFTRMSHVRMADAGMQYPSAESLVEIAAGRALHRQFASAADVQIQYLRKPYVHSKSNQ
jgi:tRNA threonylcarbamoyladenosine biosynthesis protein TsaB